MAIPLIMLLLMGFIAVGVVAKKDDWRIRIVLMLITLMGTAWFYVVW